MRTVEEALADILPTIGPVGVEVVDSLDALGRVLADDIAAPRELPPWDNSEMDGYAVRAADTAGAPVMLRLQGEVAAGQRSDDVLQPGNAVRIFTGAPLPPGADAVIKQEDVEAAGGEVRLAAPVPLGLSVRPRASDVRAGEVVLRRGAVLGPGELGLCAALGRTQLPVLQRPTVALLSTGDELCEPDRAPGPGQIVNSNAVAVAAQIRAAGAEALRLPIAPDSREAIVRRLREARRADLLLTTGGVSVGDHDHVLDALSELGCEVRFWKVRVKPGKPVAFGLWEGRPVFGLPGNPASSMVTFELFVRPALRKMMGHERVERPRARARLLEPVAKNDGRRHYLRAVVSPSAEGLVVRPLTKQASGQLTSMVGVNGLAIIPEETSTAAVGEEIEVLLLGDPR